MSVCRTGGSWRGQASEALRGRNNFNGVHAVSSCSDSRGCGSDRCPEQGGGGRGLDESHGHYTSDACVHAHRIICVHAHHFTDDTSQPPIYIYIYMYRYIYIYIYISRTVSVRTSAGGESSECGGTSICPHQRRRREFREWGGANICPHQLRRSHCKECGGASFCPHQCKMSQCKECGGASICQHQRIRTHCKECEGASALLGVDCARVAHCFC